MYLTGGQGEGYASHDARLPQHNPTRWGWTEVAYKSTAKPDFAPGLEFLHVKSNVESTSLSDVSVSLPVLPRWHKNNVQILDIC